MRAEATVWLLFSSEKQLAAVAAALEPEIHRQVGVRSTAKVALEGQFLVLHAVAEDTVALRAALNAYLRWVNSAVSVLAAVENRS